MIKIDVFLSDKRMYDALKWCIEHCDTDWDTEPSSSRSDVAWRSRTKEEWRKFMSFYENRSGDSLYGDEEAAVTFTFNDPQNAMQFKLIFG